MQFSEALGQAAPRAGVLGDVEQLVQRLQVVGLYVAALVGKTGGNSLVLLIGDLEAGRVSHNHELELTRPSTWARK